MRPQLPEYLAATPEIPMDAKLKGARIQDVRQPDEETILLSTYRSRGGAAQWVFSIGEDTARMVRHFGKPPRSLPISVFRQWLRTRLTGGIVTALRRPHPQLLAMEVRLGGGGGDGGDTYFLMLELNRRHSNLLLLDSGERLLIALRHPSQGGGRRTPGERYRPPERFFKFPGNFPLEERVPALDDDKALQLHRAWDERVNATSLEKQRRPWLQRARRELKKLRKRLEKLDEQEADQARAQEYRRWGELLQIHHALWKPGMDALEAPDVFTDSHETIRIPLDPQAGIGDNIAKCFRRFRKLRDSAPHLQRRRDETRRELAEWGEFAERLNQVETPQALEKIPGIPAPIQREFQQMRTRAGSREPADNERAGILRRISSDGFTIRVGRSDKDNEYVTFRLGKGRDWWLHAQGIGGSHVLVENPTNNPLPRKTLREAAWLAAYYSQGKREGKLEVDYTQRKYVRKLKGGKPGQVTFSQNKSVLVDLENVELKKVLQRTEVRGDGDPSS